MKKRKISNKDFVPGDLQISELVGKVFTIARKESDTGLYGKYLRLYVRQGNSKLMKSVISGSKIVEEQLEKMTLPVKVKLFLLKSQARKGAAYYSIIKQ